MDGISQSQTYKTAPSALRYDVCRADPRWFGEGIAFDDHRIKFAVSHAAGKDVLDVGCVDHDPESERSRYWVHHALRKVAKSVVGIDLYEEGVQALRAKGYNVHFADAQNFDVGASFDVIFAGDIIAHLEDLHGFIRCCKTHLRPGGKLLLTTPNPWNWRLITRAAFTKKTCGNPEQTIWVCPQTLAQLAKRHGMTLDKVRYSSGRLIDKLMPLPPGWKNSTIQAVLSVESDRPKPVRLHPSFERQAARVLLLAAGA